MSKQKSLVDAYCNSCNAFVCDQLITHDESCERCGTPIEYFGQTDIEKKDKSVVWLSNRMYELFKQYEQKKIDRFKLRELMIETTEKAKVMHEQEIKNAHFNGGDDLISIEEYFNRTFK